MSEIYTIENLSGVPNLGMVQTKIADGIPKTVEDISMHPEELWIKVQFDEELTDTEETLLGQYVDDSIGKTNYRIDSGSVFFELTNANKKNRWLKHSRRVNFSIPFFTVPTVSISNAHFDGSADIEIINIQRGYFDFRVTSTSSKGGLRGFGSVEFDWRAQAWQA